MSLQTQVCRCGKSFVQRPHHKTGKLNPITSYEVPNGNVAILDDGTYRIIGKTEQFDGPRYLSHFADCPYSAQFKEGRR